MSSAQRDGLLGAVVGIFAVAYIASARAIEDSLLADAVGAGGVPQAAGIVLLLAALALLGKSCFGRKPVDAAVATTATTPAQPTAGRARSVISAALALVLLGYALLLPVLGYIVSISLLVLAVALLGGARRRLPLALCTALSGVALWALFELVLKVRMPAGSLFF